MFHVQSISKRCSVSWLEFVSRLRHEMFINLQKLQTHTEHCFYHMRYQRILQQSVKQEGQYKFIMRTVSLNVTPQPSLDLNRRFSRHCTYVTQKHSSTLMMEPVSSSETSVYIYQDTRRHLPEDSSSGSP
jgi:hypothetical protein